MKSEEEIESSSEDEVSESALIQVTHKTIVFYIGTIAGMMVSGFVNSMFADIALNALLRNSARKYCKCNYDKFC